MTKLLYITSCSHSGSTLLTFLLAAHPRVATVGELKGTSMGEVAKYKCSCGVPIRSCSYWHRLGEALARRGVAFDPSHFGTHFAFEKAGSVSDRVVRTPVRGAAFESMRSFALRGLPGARRQFDAILERNRILIETICELRGTDVFVDASKEPVRLKYFIESGHWNVKVVHLVRDGRGVTHSLTRWPKLRLRYPTIEAAAREWRRTNKACERVLSRLPPESVVRLRYEDLCRDPLTVLRPVLRLVGEEVESIPANFKAIEHHILGNYMRLASDGRIALNEEWRSALSAEDLAAFERVAGEQNLRHGYR